MGKPPQHGETSTQESKTAKNHKNNVGLLSIEQQ